MAAGADSPQQPKPVVDKHGCKVVVINKTVSVYDTNGKLLRVEGITDYTKRNINDTYANLDDFILHWNAAEKKAEIADLLRESGIDLQALKHDQHMDDVDDFDFICHIAYGKKALTRRERAENVKKRDVFHKYGPEAQKVLNALLDKYMNEGISQLENRKVLTLDPFRQMGSPASIARLFGGNQQYFAAVHELEQEIYNAG
jgi:type I restriction enzyme R subunit